MARAGAAVVLALAVCCLLVSPAPARRPADLPPRGLHAAADREAAAEPLRPKPAVVAADCADAAEADQATAVVAVPEEEDPAREERSSSLLCLLFRCGDEPAGVSGASVARGSSVDEPQALDEGTWPAGPGKAEAEAEDEDERPYDTDWDSDSDCDSDSDDEGEEDGFLGWLWRLADRF